MVIPETSHDSTWNVDSAYNFPLLELLHRPICIMLPALPPPVHVHFLHTVRKPHSQTEICNRHRFLSTS